MTARSRQGTRARPAILGIGLELALAVSLVGALGVFHVWSRTRVLASGYALAELQQEHTRLVTSQDQLKIELGMLTSFQVLDQAARTKLSKLGLAPPDRGAVWAAGPGRPPTDSPGRAGVDGVGHRSRPAGPIVGRAEGAKATGYGFAGARQAPGHRPQAPGRTERSPCGLRPEACSLALAAGPER